MDFKHIQYDALNTRQKELYNFHKFAGRLVEYGYYSIKLSDDWQGADFLACHFNGVDFIKVQLKGKMSIDQKYEGKQIHIAFRHGKDYYIYPHDEMMEWILETSNVGNTATWRNTGRHHSRQPTKRALEFLKPYRI